MRYFTYAIPVLACTFVALPDRPSHAQLLTDVRLGVLAHDVGILGYQRESGADLNVELIFASPVPDEALTGIGEAWRWLLRPQPNVGVEANTSGYTSQGYVGLTWTVDLDNGGALWPDHAVFLGISFGPSFNTGYVRSPSPHRLSLGSNVLFHPALELGYRITPAWSISVYFDHSSNAGLARYNEGLDNLGVRAGLHF